MEDFREIREVDIIKTCQVNVSTILQKNGLSQYKLLGGFTIADNAYVVALRDPDQKDQGILYKIPMDDTSGSNCVKSERQLLGHGNDLDYVNGYYYLAMGAGNKEEGYNTERRIKRFESNFKNSKFISYQPNAQITQGTALPYVSSISHYSGSYFVLGCKYLCALCELRAEYNMFSEISRFTLPVGHSSLDLANWEHSMQGMYIKDGKLYKVLSYTKKGTDDPFQRNRIAVYNLTIDSSKKMKVELEKVFVGNDTTLDLFEIEAISSKGVKFYMATNERANNVQGDSIYVINV